MVKYNKSQKDLLSQVEDAAAPYDAARHAKPAKYNRNLIANWWHRQDSKGNSNGRKAEVVLYSAIILASVLGIGAMLYDGGRWMGQQDDVNVTPEHITEIVDKLELDDTALPLEGESSRPSQSDGRTVGGQHAAEPAAETTTSVSRKSGGLQTGVRTVGRDLQDRIAEWYASGQYDKIYALLAHDANNVKYIYALPDGSAKQGMLDYAARIRGRVHYDDARADR